MSHPSRRTVLRALPLLPLAAAGTASARAQRSGAFALGWNHPWIAYGHDVGRAWGHDGLSTSGWTCETDPGARAFTEAEVTTDPATGRGALRIQARLRGGEPGYSRGAIQISIADHWPFPCPAEASGVSVDLDGVLARIRIRLPAGSAGPGGAPTTLQLVLKTRLSAERWPSLLTAPVVVDRSWEGRSVDVIVPVDARAAAYADPGVDLTKVSLMGLVLTAHDRGTSVDGPIWLDELVVDSVPRLVYDFEQPEIGEQIEFFRRRRGRAMSLVRFFVFCDGRAEPLFAADGSVAGLGDVFFRDFDVLVRAAERHGVALMPVLLDFGWCALPRLVSGVQLGGHADVIRDPAKRRSFFDRALAPLLERYGRHPAIAAWDVCNEPEWAIDEIPDAFRPTYDLVPLADMRAFVRGCAEQVHRLAPAQRITVGSARRKWVGLWKGCGLDLYQFHWYDHFAAEEPLPWGPVEELDLDGPCLVGEVPTDNTRVSQRTFLAAAQAGGYSGLLFWSYGARDSASDLCPDLERPRPPVRRP